jgi:hypothetical protein
MTTPSVPAEPVARATALSGQQWARLALTLALVPLSWRAFHDEYGVVPLLSDIDLAIHEFGHMLFMPFGTPILGRTMVILGGSLTQVVLPLLFVVYFLRRQEGGQRRDLHASLICLWWTSMNVLSVAIYANDARAGRLMLLTGETGQESDAHDWHNLFARWGMLNRDTVIAGRMRVVAVALCAVSVVYGVYAALNAKNRSGWQQEQSS